jgi:squalene synthase HpnC
MPESAARLRQLIPMAFGDNPSLSFLTRALPRPIGREVALVLSFAGAVREVADRGMLTQADRLAQLDDIRKDLDAIAAGASPDRPSLQSLGSVISVRALPLGPFRDLLSAAADDIAAPRYGTFGELMIHVRRAANPIGRLVMHLCDSGSPRNLALSDGLASSLWLTGMLRDIPRDYAGGRLYLPLEDMERYHVSESQIANHQAAGGWRALMMSEIERVRKMLQASAPLGRILAGRVGFEARLLVMGAERILKKLHDAQGNVFSRRPVITKADWPYLVGRALFPSYRP